MEDIVADTLANIIQLHDDNDGYLVICVENDAYDGKLTLDRDIELDMQEEFNTQLALFKEKGVITQYVVDIVDTFENCGITTGALFAAWVMADGHLNSISTEWRM